MLNKLLQRQVQKFFGQSEKVPGELHDFLNIISVSYDHYEKDRGMLERSIEISSTEMVELNNELKKAHNNELAILFRNIEDVFFSAYNKEKKVLFVSPACQTIYGYTPEEFTQNPGLFREVIIPEDRERMYRCFDSLSEGQTVIEEYRIKAKSGVIRWVETKITTTLDQGKNLTRVDGVTSDITKRKEAEEILHARNTELTKTNMELDKFVYSVSHDLRAPLTSMLGVVGISKEETPNQVVLENLDYLEGSIKKLDRFIMDILDYSRNARMELKEEEINFKELLNEITDHLKYMSGVNRKVDVKINIRGNAPCFSDKSRLSVVLNNIISNAIRYQNPSATDPFVNVKIDLSDTETNIVVKDNGIGISKDHLNRIFEMFYRVSQNSIGSGLGLYIVKETVSKLAGTIEVESELGNGTSFSIHLPNQISRN